MECHLNAPDFALHPWTWTRRFTMRPRDPRIRRGPALDTRGARGGSRHIYRCRKGERLHGIWPRDLVRRYSRSDVTSVLSRSRAEELRHWFATLTRDLAEPQRRDPHSHSRALLSARIAGSSRRSKARAPQGVGRRRSLSRAEAGVRRDRLSIHAREHPLERGVRRRPTFPVRCPATDAAASAHESAPGRTWARLRQHTSPRGASPCTT